MVTEAERRVRQSFLSSIESGKVRNYKSIFRLLDVNEGGRVSKLELVTGLDKSFKVDISMPEAEEIIEKIKGVKGFSIDEFTDFFDDRLQGGR